MVAPKLLFRSHFKALLAGLLLSFTFTGTAYSQKKGWFYDYLGNIGDSSVGFSFIGPSDISDSLIGKQLSGTYFFVHQLKDFKFSGYSNMDRSIHLYQIDNKNDTLARFSGIFTKTDPKGEVTGSTGDAIITGKWYTNKDTVGLPVYLWMENEIDQGYNGQRYSDANDDDSTFESKVRYFRNAVLDGDKIDASKCIDYPITVTVNAKSVKIQTQKEFLNDYDKIFYPKFIAAIRKSIPHDMYNNYQGVMLGNGIIWFSGSGKVIAINNSVSDVQ